MLPIKLELPEHFLEEEVRDGYKVTKEYKELWAVELDLLAEFIRVCDKYDIKYCACGGTILGAVRHGGMIPWDDDIDIMMTRTEYNKLCRNSAEFKSPYFLQTEYTDRGSLRGHAQLRNSLTTGILKYEMPGHYDFNQGIFIDIFPLDNIPDDELRKKSFLKRVNKHFHRMVRFKNLPSHTRLGDSAIKDALRTVAAPSMKFADKYMGISHRMYIEYERMITAFNDTESKELGILALSSNGERFIWNRSDFTDDNIMMKFEFMEIPIPPGYRNILKKTYGNWEKPTKGGSIHGGLIFDANCSYRKFLEEDS